MTELIIAILALVAGAGIAVVIVQRSGGKAAQAVQAAQAAQAAQGAASGSAAEQELLAARQRADELMRASSEQARSSAERILADAELESQRRRSSLEEREGIIGSRESAILAKEEALAAKEQTAAAKERDLAGKEQEADRRVAEADAKRTEVRLLAADVEVRAADLDEERALLGQAVSIQRRELERVGQMTTQEAKDALVTQVVDEAKRQAMATVREIEERAREEGDMRARKILTTTIQRIASEQTTESTVTVVPLPSEEMKGRIIGREGRNIRAFEAVSGVNLVIDDTPEAVVLSSFDPVRREIARLTLEKLVGDGRIQPARIEEMHEVATREIDDEIKRAGEAALLEMHITEIHPEMIKVLGRLRYRTSYGQNVLKHLIESGHIAGGLSAELGVDPTIPIRGAFLHDIGKALSHEVEGSHAIIGAELARRLGEAPEIVHIIESHHGEVEPRTLEAVLAQTADQISGGRPGARRESLESYVKRLERLEEICTTHEGVEKTYAMQAGREVRVIVRPGEVDDVAAQVLARDIAKQVEEELQYPGQIRITVIRETRAEEYAK